MCHKNNRNHHTISACLRVKYHIAVMLNENDSCIMSEVFLQTYQKLPSHVIISWCADILMYLL